MDAPGRLRCGRFDLVLDRPLLMGIINVSADSFSGDGMADDVQRAVGHGLDLVEQGADLLDIGGESSRPGARPVDASVELRRVIPVIERLSACGVPLSVDSVKVEVMREAIAAGATMVNDINALLAPGALELLAGADAAVCLMHMQRDPATMQQRPHYDEVVAEVLAFLGARVQAARGAGIQRDRILIDPGFGFGKTLTHNLSLLRHLDCFAALGVPLLVGVSRKSMLGEITGRPVGERLAASVAAAMLAAQRGAAVLRVHDVAATRDALLVLEALSCRTND